MRVESRVPARVMPRDIAFAWISQQIKGAHRGRLKGLTAVFWG